MAIHFFLLFLLSLPTSTFSECSSTYCDRGLNAGTTAIPNKAPLRLRGRRLGQVFATPSPPPTLAPPPPPQPLIPVAPLLPVVPPPPFLDGQGSPEMVSLSESSPEMVTLLKSSPEMAPLLLGGHKLGQVCAPLPPPPMLAPPPPPQPPVPVAPFQPVVPLPPSPNGQGSSSYWIWMLVALLSSAVIIRITIRLVCCLGQQQGPPDVELPRLYAPPFYVPHRVHYPVFHNYNY